MTDRPRRSTWPSAASSTTSSSNLAERTVRAREPDANKDPEKATRRVSSTAWRRAAGLLAQWRAHCQQHGRRQSRRGGTAVIRHARTTGWVMSAVPSCAATMSPHRAQATRLPIMEAAPLESILPLMASANAYLGADVVCRAPRHRRAGRAHRPACRSRRCPGPAIHHFGWSYDD